MLFKFFCNKISYVNKILYLEIKSNNVHIYINIQNSNINKIIFFFAYIFSIKKLAIINIYINLNKKFFQQSIHIHY